MPPQAFSLLPQFRRNTTDDLVSAVKTDKAYHDTNNSKKQE